MTAHELAQLLLACPDIEVMTEGCDCWGEAVGVDSVPGQDGEIVLITREKYL